MSTTVLVYLQIYNNIKLKNIWKTVVMGIISVQSPFLEKSNVCHHIILIPPLFDNILNKYAIEVYYTKKKNLIN